MMDVSNESVFLHKWQEITSVHEDALRCFLHACEPIGFEYLNSKNQTPTQSFNVFGLVSDLYYRENFHSDVISFFLDSTESHGCGDKFLIAFISMLNKSGRNIDARCYRDAEAVREEGRIDILIKSEKSKRAIIIENKMNNAGDMPRQLPRYFDYVHPNYQIDAIVYLTPDKAKSPDKSDWSKADEANVKPLLVTIPSFDKSNGINLVDSWLRPSQDFVDNLDVLSTIRQYSRLLQILNANAMDTIVLEKFHKELLQGENLKTAQSIRNMLNELPSYMARRIQEKYANRCFPFSKVWIYSSNDAVFEGAEISGLYLKIDICCSEDGYEIIFWSPSEAEEPVFGEIVSKVKSLSDFAEAKGEKNRVTRTIGFTGENEVYAFLDNILRELSELKDRQ